MNPAPAAAGALRKPFGEFEATLAVSTSLIAVKMFSILMRLIVVLEILKATGGIEILVRLTASLLRLLDLKRPVGVLGS